MLWFRGVPGNPFAQQLDDPPGERGEFVLTFGMQRPDVVRLPGELGGRVVSVTGASRLDHEECGSSCEVWLLDATHGGSPLGVAGCITCGLWLWARIDAKSSP